MRVPKEKAGEGVTVPADRVKRVLRVMEWWLWLPGGEKLAETEEHLAPYGFIAALMGSGYAGLGPSTASPLFLFITRAWTTVQV